ncbi:hypothetical protein DPMN_106428 [Dreissena polymorpha]|uniref:Uncharacterized protein n=1 Tax=Dreissena polymorpha TaxID=45954 RepID=A0A9D4K559_DREPO|nr:hypothetical protein DPMN_106428 [Dreissena polymorpha]
MILGWEANENKKNKIITWSSRTTKVVKVEVAVVIEILVVVVVVVVVVVMVAVAVAVRGGGGGDGGGGGGGAVAVAVPVAVPVAVVVAVAVVVNTAPPNDGHGLTIFGIQGQIIADASDDDVHLKNIIEKQRKGNDDIVDILAENEKIDQLDYENGVNDFDTRDLDSPTSEVIEEPAESNNQDILMSNLESDNARLKLSDVSNASKSDDNEDVISDSDVSNGSNSDDNENVISDSDVPNGSNSDDKQDDTSDSDNMEGSNVLNDLNSGENNSVVEISDDGDIIDADLPVSPPNWNYDNER